MSNAVTFDSTVALFEAFKKDFQQPNPDIKKCGDQLAKLKRNLVQLSFLQQASTKELLLTREILELGAQWSVKAKDVESFERYIAQLKTYYQDYSDTLPDSPRRLPLLSLHLLHLLSTSRLSDFHTEIELLPPNTLASNVYVRHPVRVEQWLMEGRFNKVWAGRADVPGEEFGFFMDVLIGNIRKEIGSCIEKAYERLAIQDAATLLYFKTADEVNKFCTERGWKIVNGEIVFSATSASAEPVGEIPAPKVIRHALGYARELERIV